jgi:hypothetical protein
MGVYAIMEKPERGADRIDVERLFAGRAVHQVPDAVRRAPVSLLEPGEDAQPRQDFGLA